MRGLKPLSNIDNARECRSHLLQMRGLKHTVCEKEGIDLVSHLLQMRGLKLREWSTLIEIGEVASFTDAWIETTRMNLR